LRERERERERREGEGERKDKVIFNKRFVYDRKKKQSKVFKIKTILPR